MPAYVQASVRLQPDVELRCTSYGPDGQCDPFVTVEIGPEVGSVTIFCRDADELDRLASVLAQAKALLAKQTKAAA